MAMLLKGCRMFDGGGRDVAGGQSICFEDGAMPDKTREVAGHVLMSFDRLRTAVARIGFGTGPVAIADPLPA